uniref:Uncharacterized protein n=1 Tax=Candidatus Kentrum sp. TC TaxID=2126339 RepID=A0A450Y897_9GAMM|nr:MAG: hypothetical protein BECKTC1821E_GA0114239_100178 [Candidatus Kentron sp. TC]
MIRMNNPKVTQAEPNRATFRVGFEPASRRQRITLSPDTNLIDYIGLIGRCYSEKKRRRRETFVRARAPREFQ